MLQAAFQSKKVGNQWVNVRRNEQKRSSLSFFSNIILRKSMMILIVKVNVRWCWIGTWFVIELRSYNLFQSWFHWKKKLEFWDLFEVGVFSRVVRKNIFQLSFFFIVFFHSFKFYSFKRWQEKIHLYFQITQVQLKKNKMVSSVSEYSLFS